jgi:hypothetical protein
MENQDASPTIFVSVVKCSSRTLLAAAQDLRRMAFPGQTKETSACFHGETANSVELFPV